MPSSFRAIALAASLLTVPAFADEDYCGDIPAQQLRFEYRVAGPDSAVLRIHLPLRFEQSKFQDVSVVFGTDRSYAATIATENGEGEALAVIHVPRGRDAVSVEAVYVHHGKNCFRLLKATFRNGQRVSASDDQRS